MLENMFCDVASNWETSKENVQPLRSGRSAAFLKAALQPSEEHTKYLVQERQKFEEEILAGENSQDPIESWDKYLKWIQQNFPIGENQRTFENVLRKFIVKFLKYENYRDDPRYINAWITLARISDNPENIYSYMKSEGFGCKSAAFYVAWAEEHEKNCAPKKAAAIYKLGEESRAEPYSLLQKMKNAFELRSARDAVKNLNIERKGPSPTVSSAKGHADISERKALSSVSGRKRLPFSNTVKKATTNQSKTSGLVIFRDEDNDLDFTGKWADVPDSQTQNKENSVQKPSSWKGSRITPRVKISRYPETPISSTRFSFSIFEEDTPDSGLVAPPSARKVSRNVERVLAERKKPQTELSFQQILHDCTEDKDVRIVRQYPFEKVYSVMGEFQLEEIIAAVRRKKKRDGHQEQIKVSGL